MTDKKTPIDPITHDDERMNIPTPELAPMMDPDDAKPIKVAYQQRNPDLDPQLIWRGKDIDQTSVTVDAPPIYLQEQVHPKAIIEDLRAGNQRNGEGGGADLFDHFGITEDDREAEVEFYKHHKKWSNRMILGDGLQVMASLAEREGLKGQVQMIFIDPPYGIKFNSNFQWSTTSKEVKDGKLDHLTREPEQVKAFRDTWRDGIHSYLQYLRDRLVVARQLLTESGSCFVQIGDENVHRVRALMDEIFGEENFISLITFKKTHYQESENVSNIADYLILYAKNIEQNKHRKQWIAADLERLDYGKYTKAFTENGVEAIPKAWRKNTKLFEAGWRPFRSDITLTQDGEANEGQFPWNVAGKRYVPGGGRHWRTHLKGRQRLAFADRVNPSANRPFFIEGFDDSPSTNTANIWTENLAGAQGKVYVVQTNERVLERCILMSTDPGDLVLDPTCGSGTTAFVAEQWGRRWITIDTSRVALALARARIMGAKYPWYLLADSKEGQKKEAEITRSGLATSSTYNDIRHGFVYGRVPRVMLKNIAANSEIDEIWEERQPAVEDARAALNAALTGQTDPFPVETGGRNGQDIDFTASGEVEMPSGEMAPANGFMEWEIPREPGTPWPADQRKFYDVARTVSDDLTPAKRKAAETALANLNNARSTSWDFDTLPDRPVTPWPEAAEQALADFWKARIARQTEIDASIAAKADFEYLYDKPYEDKKRVRVAGPFTVESLSPHRTQAVNEHGELIEEVDAATGQRMRDGQEADNYREAMLENLRKAGVQQSGKEDAINFTSLVPWPGEWIAAEGKYMEGETERRAGVFIGPEYGTVQRADLVAAAREAADAGLDILIACAFNFDAHTAEFRKLGRVPILQARMNPDLHMAGDLKAGGGNLFVVFGEPDIKVTEDGDKLRVQLLGVDIFKPATGQVISSEPDDIACWFIDTDYNEESFFVRHAYFPGADIPYKQLKTTLKGEIDEEAWDSLKRTVSRPFARPKSGRIAVKVINHLGDEVMKVLGV